MVKTPKSVEIVVVLNNPLVFSFWGYVVYKKLLDMNVAEFFVRGQKEEPLFSLIQEDLAKVKILKVGNQYVDLAKLKIAWGLSV